MPRTTDASRKLLIRLRARVEDGAVRLRFYLATPLFLLPPKEREGIVIRIFRRAEPDFVFGEDYDEYFDGAAPQAADRIFEGALEAINNRKFEFVDKKVEAGQTYIYWISSNRGDAPTGPVAVKVRHPEVWWTEATLRVRLEALAKKHPKLVTLKDYGRTVGGRAIPGVVVGRGAKAVGLVGTVHAGESGPELIVPVLERLLAEDVELLDKVRIAALPSVNLDERERLARGVPWYIRTNANGVDLNRNFDAGWEYEDRMYGLLTTDPDSLTYRGRSSASEPETKAVVAFIRSVKPDVVFSYHWLGSIAGCGLLAPKSASGDQAFRQAVQPLATAFTQGFLKDRRRAGRVGYVCTPGSFSEWAYKKHGIPCFDVEGSRKRPIEEAGATDQATPEMLREYQERHYRGIRAVVQELAR
jgi:hypothetical protein